MDPEFRTLFLDCLRTTDLAPEVKLLAAKGAVAPRALDQIGALMWLSDAPEPEVAAAARATIEELPKDALASFLARQDVPDPVRSFFAERGIVPAAVPLADPDPDPFPVGAALPPADPAVLQDVVAAAADEPAKVERQSVLQRLASMSVPERLSLAMRGSREVRAILIRDPNKLVSTAVIASPRLTESEVEAIARMTNVAEEILRIIAGNRSWTKNYAVVAALTKNPKTPVALSMNLLPRLNDRDVRALAANRNVPDVLRMNARKRMSLEKA